MPHQLEFLSFELVGKMILSERKVQFLRAPKALLVAETTEPLYWHETPKTNYRIDFEPFDSAGHLYEIHESPPPGYFPAHPFKQS